jgi:hypothetical protein
MRLSDCVEQPQKAVDSICLLVIVVSIFYSDKRCAIYTFPNVFALINLTDTTKPTQANRTPVASDTNQPIV